MKKPVILFVIVAMAAPSLTAAQSAPPPQVTQPTQTIQTAAAGLPLTLKDAEATAVKNHPQVLSAQYQALASNEQVREQLSAYYPTVFGSITGSVADQQTRIGAGFLTD